MRSSAGNNTLIIMLLWLAMLLSAALVPAAQAESLSHLLEHSEQLKHHHHNDFAIHVDAADSINDAPSHIHADVLSSPLAILRSPTHMWVTQASDAPTVAPSSNWTVPVLAGLFRPPRHAA